MTEDPTPLGTRRYRQRILSPIFPAPVTAQPEDVLEGFEWDGSTWQSVGHITQAELDAQRDE